MFVLPQFREQGGWAAVNTQGWGMYEGCIRYAAKYCLPPPPPPAAPKMYRRMQAACINLNVLCYFV